MVNDWKHDLCGCFDDIEATCLAYWVPCVQYGLNAEAVGHDCCAYGCMFLLAASFGVPCVAGMILREEIRRKRGIEGDSCNDCLIWTFLGCCALVQEAQELKVRLFPLIGGDFILFGTFFMFKISGKLYILDIYKKNALVRFSHNFKLINHILQYLGEI